MAIEETPRQKKAEELFRSGFNCSQAVAGVFCEDLGADFDTVMKLSEGFGGGMARMRLTCGAVSGMAMVTGLLMSRGAGEGNTRGIVYEAVHELADRFKEKNGSVICAELLGLDKNGQYDPVPEARTEAYYKKRPCIGCIKDCVDLLDKKYFA